MCVCDCNVCVYVCICVCLVYVYNVCMCFFVYVSVCVFQNSQINILRQMNIIMLSVFLLSVVILSDIKPSVIASINFATKYTWKWSEWRHNTHTNDIQHYSKKVTLWLKLCWVLLMLECQNRTAHFEKCELLFVYQNYILLRHLVVEILVHVSMLFNTWPQFYKTFTSVIYKIL